MLRTQVQSASKVGSYTDVFTPIQMFLRYSMGKERPERVTRPKNVWAVGCLGG